MRGGSRGWNAILIFAFLLFLELLSWMTASWQSGCLVGSSASQKFTLANLGTPELSLGSHTCATFFGGSMMLVERAALFTRLHETSVVAAYAIILALAIVGILLSTHWSWTSHDKQVVVPLSAASDVAHAGATRTMVQRPYIFIWGIAGTGPISRLGAAQQEAEQDAIFIYNVSNGGNLPAVIETVSIAYGYEKDGEYPPLRMIDEHSLLRTPILISGQNIEHILEYIPWRELDGSDPTPEFRQDLFLRVVIAYRGPFTQGHETSQSWHYVRPGDAFAEIPDERCSYFR